MSARLRALAKASSWARTEMPSRTVSVRGTSRRVEPRSDTTLVTGSSSRIGAPDASFDLVLTDPPYHDDVQYAELSWLFRAWAGSNGHVVGDVTVGSEGCASDGYRLGLADIFREIRRTLKPEGHLIFSYANRDPSAWVALVGALDDAGFKAAGFAAVQSENETDHSKRGRRSTTFDLLIDVVPSEIPVAQFTPELDTSSEQQRFLQRVGSWILKAGSLGEGWEAEMEAHLASSVFLAA